MTALHGERQRNRAAGLPSIERRVRNRQDVVVTMLKVPVVVVSALADASVAARVPDFNELYPCAHDRATAVLA
jgi:hypothetical protein